jgi:hypothetical protein
MRERERERERGRGRERVWDGGTSEQWFVTGSVFMFIYRLEKNVQVSRNLCLWTTPHDSLMSSKLKMSIFQMT